MIAAPEQTTHLMAEREGERGRGGWDPTCPLRPQTQLAGTSPGPDLLKTPPPSESALVGTSLWGTSGADSSSQRGQPRPHAAGGPPAGPHSLSRLQLLLQARPGGSAGSAGGADHETTSILRQGRPPPKACGAGRRASEVPGREGPGVPPPAGKSLSREERGQERAAGLQVSACCGCLQALEGPLEGPSGVTLQEMTETPSRGPRRFPLVSHVPAIII